jgi:threonine 3-dehydrogenase
MKPAWRSRQMRAIVKSKPKKGLWMEAVNVPEPGTDEVLIKVTQDSICGTDKHIYHWDSCPSKNIAPPLILGLEHTQHVRRAAL